MKIRLLGLTALLSSSVLMTPALTAQDVSYSASIDAITEYVFRGFGLGTESIQVGAEAAIGDFSIGVWTSTGIGEESVINADEIDIYGSYGFALSDTVSASVGATLYHYPQAGDLFSIGTDPGDASTFEIFGGVSFDEVTLAPAVTLYYDTTLETLTLEGGISGSAPTGDKSSFDWGLMVGHVDPDGGNYQYAKANLALSYAVTGAVSGYVGVNGSLASEDNFLDYEEAVSTATFNFDSSTLWLGAGLSTSF